MAVPGLLDAYGVSVLDLAEAGARRAGGLLDIAAAAVDRSTVLGEATVGARRAGGLLDIAAAARRGLLDTAAAVDRGTVTSVLGEATAACLFDIAAGARVVCLLSDIAAAAARGLTALGIAESGARGVTALGIAEAGARGVRVLVEVAATGETATPGRDADGMEPDGGDRGVDTATITSTQD